MPANLCSRLHRFPGPVGREACLERQLLQALGGQANSGHRLWWQCRGTHGPRSLSEKIRMFTWE